MLLLMIYNNYRPCVRNTDSRLLQISHKSEKWRWHHNLPKWRRRQLFWRCRVSPIKFTYWYKVHINIITGPGVITIFVFKGLTRHLEIGNTLVWILSNIWGLGRFRDTKFVKNVTNEKLLKLQNARFKLGQNRAFDWCKRERHLFYQAT